MEAIRKQASKLREQVARQQQAVFKQFGGAAYGNSDNAFADSAAYQQHQKLEKLHSSTRAAKHFQRDIVRGVEGYIVTGSKQVEIGNKLSEDSRKYGAENTCTSGNTLSKAALCYARARAQIENERGNLLKALGTQGRVSSLFSYVINIHCHRYCGCSWYHNSPGHMRVVKPWCNRAQLALLTSSTNIIPLLLRTLSGLPSRL